MRSTPSAELGEVIETLRPDRIGHGILAARDPTLMAALREQEIVLEICPTSNLLTRALADENAVRDTFRAFVDNGVAFTIATDGPEMMRTHLRDELELLERIGALDEDELAEANRHAATRRASSRRWASASRARRVWRNERSRQTPAFMAEELTGPRAKVERAKKHFADLEPVIGGFFESSPYEVLPEEDHEAGQMVYKVTKAASPPDAIALIAGDVIHNLRASLDLLFCQLILAHGQQIVQSDSYRITDTAKLFETARMAQIRAPDRQGGIGVDPAHKAVQGRERCPLAFAPP